mmetsp:Transcript_16496/g.35954  ORF Transcript_16496/g.35954 Transcript_16496/m.35954 type:complete len:138 (-) Transcript_16496:157-570(-)
MNKLLPLLCHRSKTNKRVAVQKVEACFSLDAHKRRDEHRLLLPTSCCCRVIPFHWHQHQHQQLQQQQTRREAGGTMAHNHNAPLPLLLAEAEDGVIYDDDGNVVLQRRQEIVEITFDLGDSEEKLRRFLCRMNRIMM